MGFPNEPLRITTELQIAGVWTDISGDVNNRQVLEIVRGRADEGSRVDPGRVTVQLDNRSGTYSPRNPLSPLFGDIGRNTPVRISVREGEPFLEMDGTPAGTATTPGHASLDITGDLDLRAEATIDWYDPVRNQVLIAKWDAGTGQRSYLLRVFNNLLVLNWSTDGTVQFTGSFSLDGMSLPPRAALRATLDVDDGAGQLRVDAYWAVSLDGPWTELGAITGSVGTTSVHAGTAPLAIGGHDPTTSPPRTPPTGAVHRAEVRNGIGGPAVAAPDFRTQALGAAGFADSAGRPWTVNAPAAVSNRRTRFTGEVAAWPPEADAAGRDLYVPARAAGIMRRLNQGRKPVPSTLRRRIPSGDPVAYWPLEEGGGATRAYSPVGGVAPADVSGLRFAAEDSLPGSAALPVLGPDASLTAPVPAAPSGAWQTEFVYLLDAMPAALATMAEISTTGTVRRHRLMITVNNVQLKGYDGDGAQVYAIDVQGPAFTGAWSRVQIRARPLGGGQCEATVWWGSVAATGGHFATDTYTGSAGRVTAVSSRPGASLDGMALGHLAVFPTSPVYIFDGADTGFAGEPAHVRIRRVCAEQAVPFYLQGRLISLFAGPQRPAALMDVLRSAAEADGGVLLERRDTPALVYHPHEQGYNRPVALTLHWGTRGEVPPGLRPVEDDQALRNDITVTRRGGSSARAADETSRLSVRPPPDGAGRYDEEVTLDLADDITPAFVAGWRLHLGTWDEARYPVITVNLAAAPHLTDAAAALDIGDRIQITGCPLWAHPDGVVDAIIRGYTERLSLTRWELELTCTPGRPWTVVHTDDPAGIRSRTDTDTGLGGSALAVPVTATATTLDVATLADAPRWTTDCADTPFDIRTGGETMTVTNIADGAYDTFTRTVSSGWGSTDDGHAWTTSGGAASAYSVSSGHGHVAVSAVNSSRFCLLTAATPVFDFAATVETDVLAAGGPHYPQLVARYADSSNYYSARLAFNTDQSVTLSIRKRVGGSESELASHDLPGVSHAAGRQFSVRFWGNGSTLRARAWLASGPEQELTWLLEAADTDLTAAGSLGLRSILSSANTNPLPVNVTYDDLTVYNPQVMTVTRSQNGIVKPHPAGTDVRLAQPPVLAVLAMPDA